MDLTEGLTVEFKREYVDEIKKTVIAFANTAGGRIYIGINNDGTIAGVCDTDAVILQASNAVRDAIHPDVTMFVSYHVEKIDDKNVIIIEVQKGTSCPYYIVSKGIRPGGVYVRQGASSVPATETTIFRMIKETDGDKYECIRSTEQDLTFETAEKEFALANIKFGTQQKKSLHIINEDDMYTNLARLLSDQCVHTIKAAVFEGEKKETFKDRTEFTGSILKQISGAYEYINRYNKLHSEYDNLHRIDKRDYPEQTIREALLNAIVHRDYAFSGSTLISIFDNRIEFISIGGLVKGISYDDMMLGVSIQRNENLANVFYRLSLIEAFGTGIPKMLRSYSDCIDKPEITVTDNAFKIMLPNMNNKPVCYPKSNTSAEKVMSLFNTQSSIQRHDVEILLGVSQATASRILKSLIINERIVKIGNTKNLRYEKL